MSLQNNSFLFQSQNGFQVRCEIFGTFRPGFRTLEVRNPKYWLVISVFEPLMTFSCYGKSLANSLMTLALGGRHTKNKTLLSLAQAKPRLKAAVVGQENDAQSEQHKQYNTQQRKTGVLGLKPDSLPRYIAVEGPIGVGKTSLTKRLASSLNYETFLEAPERNPFLERFYQNRKQAALQTQLFFLFERARQIQELRQGDMFEPVRVADFLLEKDRLFAELERM